MRIRFTIAVINIATVEYFKNLLLFAVIILNKSFPSREDICRAREKCDTLGELFFFNPYDFITENIWEFHCREKNQLGINQKIDAKFKSHRQKKNQLLNAVLPWHILCGCFFCVNLLYSWGMTFSLGAMVLFRESLLLHENSFC